MAGWEDAVKSYDGGAMDGEGIGDNETEKVAKLARSLSLTQVPSYLPNDVNPFLSSDPRLDPKSVEFDARYWTKAMLRVSILMSGERPRLTGGFSYRNV